jgi:LuxR family maltose regulon positive regulatory protein
MIVKDPRSATVLVLTEFMDYRKSFVKTLKKLQLFPFKSSLKTATPSISQNMPYLHRSFRDCSEIASELDRNLTLFAKSFNAVMPHEAPVMLECFRAGILYEQGKLNAAFEHAVNAHMSITPSCSPEIKFCAFMIFARILYADDKTSEADAILEKAKTMTESEKAFYLNANLKSVRCNFLLANGDKNAARYWLEENRRLIQSDELLFYRLPQYFTTARAYIVLENSTNAIMLLKRLRELSGRYRRTIDMIEADLLLAIAYWKKSRTNHVTSLEYLEQAVELAYEHNYVQAFANEGADLVNMLFKLQKRVIQPMYDGTTSHMSSFIKVLYVSAVEGAKRCKGLTGGNPPERLTFTEKQKIVMGYLCDGLSRNDISKKMNVKPNTIKSHIELIYKKLDVINNLDAIMKIKKLGIVK